MGRKPKRHAQQSGEQGRTSGAPPEESQDASPQVAPPQVAPPQVDLPRQVPPQAVPLQEVPPQPAPPQEALPRQAPPQEVLPRQAPPQEATPAPIAKSKKSKQKFKKLDLSTIQTSETQPIIISKPPVQRPPPTQVQQLPIATSQPPVQIQPTPITSTPPLHLPPQQVEVPVPSMPVRQVKSAPITEQKGKGKGKGLSTKQKDMDPIVDATSKLKIDETIPRDAVSAPQVIPSQKQEKKEEPTNVLGPVKTPLPSSSPAKLTTASSRAPPQQPSQVTSQHKISQGTPPPAGSPGSGSSLKVPKRNNNEGNKVGRKIRVETNHLPLTIASEKDGIHYDVTIEPDKPKKFLMEVMQKYITKSFPGRYPAFDGLKNLYSCGELPLPSGYHSDTIEIIEEGRKDPLKFEVAIKMVARVDFSSLANYMKQGSSQDAPQRAIQCLDVVLRHAPLLRFVKVGKSFFSAPEGSVVSLGGGLDMWYGLFQSAILGWKPFINIDIAHKGFPKRQGVVELIQELSNPRDDVRNSRAPLRRDVIENLKKFIKGLKVEYEIPRFSATKRSYRVNDVVDPPGQIRFKMDDGRQLTVIEYFERERKYTIKFPHLPCLWVGSRNSERKICYPVELCTVLPGQVIIRKMDSNQTSNMIRSSACASDERKRKIMSALQNMRYNQEPTLKEFGLKVSERFEEIEGRVIPAPSLEYANKDNRRHSVQPTAGMWRAGKFRTAAELKNWMIIGFDRYSINNVEPMVDMLIKMGKSVGMKIDRPNIYEIQLRDLRPLMADAAKQKAQLVMAIVGEMGNQYAQVKQAAELTYGILTQCVRKRTVERMNESTASQLLLKINAKLDCTNHTLSPGTMPCLSRPCMIVGADVTHPAPGQLGEPSIAAVVASHDPSAYKYNITVRLQPPKMEIITDLRAMIREQLLFFHNKTTFKPLRIIYFRDGVSEGQFESVLNSELTAIRAACSDLDVDYKPKITFFVVQKRHHTRFFPVDPRDGDKNKNVPVGTCIDSVITHPTELDFYLLSHASIKGTARPTRYYRLWDDADMSEAEVQQLAFQLCHLYTRCNRSVSYPAPTYYAHHAAARAKVHAEGVTLDMDNLQAEQFHLNVKDEIRKERPMFFV